MKIIEKKRIFPKILNKNSFSMSHMMKNIQIILEIKMNAITDMRSTCVLWISNKEYIWERTTS